MRAKSSAGIQGDSSHPDWPLLSKIDAAILTAFGGHERMSDFMAEMLRKVIDDVVDTAETGRRFIGEIEKTEKTYIGTKVEIVLRHKMGFPKGKVLDLLIDGEEVDVKFTMGGRSGNWMVPPEAVGRPLLLVAASETENLCWVGLIVADMSKLSASANRDGKRTISQTGFDNIWWLIKGRAYEPNFWADIPQDIAAWAFDKEVSGSVRMMRLFRTMARKPIPRRVVKEVAQQLDFMRRVRGNGGARDIIGPDMVILSDFMGSDAVRNLGLPPLPRNSFIAIDIRDAKERAIIEQSSQTRTTKGWAARRSKPKGPINSVRAEDHDVPFSFNNQADPDFDVTPAAATWSKDP